MTNRAVGYPTNYPNQSTVWKSQTLKSLIEASGDPLTMAKMTLTKAIKKRPKVKNTQRVLISKSLLKKKKEAKDS